MDFLEIKQCLISLRESGKVFLVPHTQKCVTNFCFVFLSLYIKIRDCFCLFVFCCWWCSLFFGGGGGGGSRVLGDQTAVFVHHEGFGIKCCCFFLGGGVYFFLNGGMRVDISL